MGHKNSEIHSGGAPEGNNNNRAAKTEAEAIKLIEAYCIHLAQGFSKESFEPCDYRTIDAIIEQFKHVDLQADSKIKAAIRKGRRFWEMLGINGTMGKREFKLSNGEKIKLAAFNAMSWKFNMQNRYGWKERTDMTTDDENLNNMPRKVVFNNPKTKKDGE